MDADSATTGPDSTIHARSVSLSDDNLGLTAKIDLLELDGDTATPVEYKKGAIPDVPGNIYDSTLVQVCVVLAKKNGKTRDE